MAATGQSTGNGDAATPLRLDGPDSFLHLVVASPGSFLAPRPLPRERIPVARPPTPGRDTGQSGLFHPAWW
jgi:hypothetical protein